MSGNGSGLSSHPANVDARMKEQWHDTHLLSRRPQFIQEVYIANKLIDPFEDFLRKAKEQMDQIMKSRPRVKPIVSRQLRQPSSSTAASLPSVTKAHFHTTLNAIIPNERTVVSVVLNPREPSAVAAVSSMPVSAAPVPVFAEGAPTPAAMTSNLTLRDNKPISQGPSTSHRKDQPSVSCGSLNRQNPVSQSSCASVEVLRDHSFNFTTTTSVGSSRVTGDPKIGLKIAETAHTRATEPPKKRGPKKKIGLISDPVVKPKRKIKDKKCRVLLIDYYKAFGNIRFRGEGFLTADRKKKSSTTKITSGIARHPETSSDSSSHKPKTGCSVKKRAFPENHKLRKEGGDDIQGQEPSLKKSKRKGDDRPDQTGSTGTPKIDVNRVGIDPAGEQGREASNKENIEVGGMEGCVARWQPGGKLAHHPPSNQVTATVDLTQEPTFLNPSSHENAQRSLSPSSACIRENKAQGMRISQFNIVTNKDSSSRAIHVHSSCPATKPQSMSVGTNTPDTFPSSSICDDVVAPHFDAGNTKESAPHANNKGCIISTSSLEKELNGKRTPPQPICVVLLNDCTKSIQTLPHLLRCPSDQAYLLSSHEQTSLQTRTGFSMPSPAPLTTSNHVDENANLGNKENTENKSKNNFDNYSEASKLLLPNRRHDLFLNNLSINFCSNGKSLVEPLTALPTDNIPTAEFDAVNMRVQAHRTLQRKDSSLVLSTLMWRDLTCFVCSKSFPDNAEWTSHVTSLPCSKITVHIK